MSHNSEATDISEWWAHVYYTTLESENVLVSKIRKFRPSHLDDYNKKEKYTVRTSLNSEDGLEHKHKAFIIRLAETREELLESLEKARPRYPSFVNWRDSDAVSTTDAETTVPSKTPLSVQQVRTQNAKVRKRKAEATLNNMEQFARVMTGEDKENETEENSTPPEHNSAEYWKREAKRLKEELEAQKREREQERANDSIHTISSASSSVNNPEVIGLLKNMDSRLKKVEDIGARLQVIEDLCSKSIYMKNVQPLYKVQEWLKSIPDN